MKKSERLELENKVLKNMLDNIRCEIDNCHITGGGVEMAHTLGAIRAISNSFDGRMAFAENHGYLEYDPIKKERK